MEAVAIAQHPALSQYKSRVASASGQRMQAGLPHTPVFQYQSEEIGNDDSSGIHSINLSQRIVTGDKLALAQWIQMHGVDQRRSKLQRRTHQVRTDVQVKFEQAWVEQ